MRDHQIEQLSEILSKKSIEEADFHPIDRFFLAPYIGKILEVNGRDFLVYNLERMPSLYSTYLMLCLPELWESLTADDLIEIIERFSLANSFFTLIFFTYKFVEIDIIKLILTSKVVKAEIKEQIKSYLKNQYNTFLKTDTDFFFFEKGVIGVDSNEWVYIKQKLLIDNRISPALQTVSDLEKYINSF